MTCFHKLHAVEPLRAQVVRVLCSAKADVKAVDEEGWTPLYAWEPSVTGSMPVAICLTCRGFAYDICTAGLEPSIQSRTSARWLQPSVAKQMWPGSC